MIVSEQIKKIKENVPMVHQAGYEMGYSSGYSDGEQAEYDKFWNIIQDNGERVDYSGAFRYWGVERLSPKYKLIPESNSSGLFLGCRKLKSIDAEKFDLSEALYNPTSSSSTSYMICEYCNSIEVFPDIGLQAGYYGYAFCDCFNLHTIEVLRVTKDCTFGSGAFRNCDKLKNIINIEGEIGKSVVFDKSTELSTETIVRIIEHLSSEVSGQTLTINSTAKINMTFPYTSPETNTTYDDWDSLIATKPNWNVSI